LTNFVKLGEAIGDQLLDGLLLRFAVRHTSSCGRVIVPWQFARRELLKYFFSMGYRFFFGRGPGLALAGRLAGFLFLAGLGGVAFGLRPVARRSASISSSVSMRKSPDLNELSLIGPMAERRNR
jgi:hypothetical protein